MSEYAPGATPTRSLGAATPLLTRARDARADTLLKWALCVVVMLVVDLVWLWIGVTLGRIPLSPRVERVLNVAMGTRILAAAVVSLT